MSEAFLIINSEDRDKSIYKNPADFRVSGSQQSFDGRDISSLKASEFSMKFDIPNINQRNNGMVLDDGSTSYPIQLPEGFYDEAALAPILQAQIIGVLGVGQVVVWSTVQQRFSITTTIPIMFTQYPSQVRDLSDMLGFIKEGSLLTVNVSGSSDLVYTRNIYVKSNNLHKHKNIQDQSTTSILTDVLMICPVYQPGADTSKPQTISYQANWPKSISYDSSGTVSSFDMQLLDDQGNYLYNPDSSDNSWSYHLYIIASR